MINIINASITSFENPWKPYLKAAKLGNGSISCQLQFKAIQDDQKALPTAEEKARTMLAFIDHIRTANPNLDVAYRDSYLDRPSGKWVATCTVYVNAAQVDTATTVEAAVASAFKTLGLTAEDIKGLMARKAAQEQPIIDIEQPNV